MTPKEKLRKASVEKHIPNIGNSRVLLLSDAISILEEALSKQREAIINNCKGYLTENELNLIRNAPQPELD